MGEAAGWTTGSSSGCGGAPNMRTSICRITATGWRLDADWADGLTATTGCDHTRRWAMRRRRTRMLMPARTEPNQPGGKRCSLPDAGATAALDGETSARRKLEIRPPAAVEWGTLRKRRG